MNDSVSIPLCVDLDGTLVKLDTLHQALFLLLRRSPTSIFRIPGWLAKGKAHLKDQVMQRVSLDAHVLPYHQAFLAYLHQEHQKGRLLVLATASNYRTADAVAEHLGIFPKSCRATLIPTCGTNENSMPSSNVFRSLATPETMWQTFQSGKPQTRLFS